MHLAIAIVSVLAVWRWADWKNWEKYHATILYIALGNLMYFFLTYHHWLWRINPDFYMNYLTVEVMYTMIIFPSTAFLFLSNFPESQGISKQFIHIAKWVGLYVVMEWIGGIYGRILYQYGWSLMWSAIFDCIMFPMLRLHNKKPAIAYPLSVAIAVFLLLLFDIPLATRE